MVREYDFPIAGAASTFVDAGTTRYQQMFVTPCASGRMRSHWVWSRLSSLTGPVTFTRKTGVRPCTIVGTRREMLRRGKRPEKERRKTGNSQVRISSRGSTLNDRKPETKKKNYEMARKASQSIAKHRIQSLGQNVCYNLPTKKP